MDQDFADFLLDESHFDLKQKQIDDADFFEGLKLSDDEEEKFFLTVDFEPEPRPKLEENDDFDIPFEITSEDLALMEAEEQLIARNSTNSIIKPKKNNHRRVSSTVGENKNTLVVDSHEVDKLKADLEFYRDRTDFLNQELNAQKRQILTKEGEITILRQRLVQIDNEKILTAQKYAERTESNRKTLEKIESKWKQEVENLKTEIIFKEQELRSVSSSIKRKLPKGVGTFEDPDFNKFGTIKNNNEAPVSKSTSPIITSNDQINEFSAMSDLELFTLSIQKIDASWTFSEMKDFDTLDIVKAREFACDEIKKKLKETKENKSGRALAHGMIKLFERALHFRQSILLSYTSQLLAYLFDNCGDIIKDDIFEIRDENNSVILFKQIGLLLTGRLIIDGIPKEIILNQLIIFNVILYQLERKIPAEFKAIINSGFFQWILRWEQFTGKETKIIGMTLYSLSCDLSMLSAVFLSSESDKIECVSVLDLLLSRAEILMDSLFPRGQIYRSRFGSQLPLLDDEIDRLQKINVVLSLLFSFVHRCLGPVTLWMPEKLILSQVIWAIDIFDHDMRTFETLEFLPPKALIAQEELLDTIFSGLAAAWTSKDIDMASILTETRIPLGFSAEIISSNETSYCGAAKSAAILAKIIDREVSDDVRSVYETGIMPRSE